MDTGASSQSSAVGGGATAHKKKRFHGNAAAAIAARRAGHGHGGSAAAAAAAAAAGRTNAAADDEEAAFISSSRDASEEDNDEASGFSDSASSLRFTSHAANTHHRIASPLPTSARDKALVESRDAHRRAVVPSADKTPLSSSPSRHFSSTLVQPVADTNMGVSANEGYPLVATTLPPDGLGDPHTSAMLSHATAALLDANAQSAHTSSVVGQDSGSTKDVNKSPSISRLSASAQLARHESSGGSEASDYGNTLANYRDPKLSLGTLPAPVTSFASAGGAGQHSASTPKAPIEAQRETEPPASVREARRKRTTSLSAHHAGSETDGEATDNAAASPYDGDVEFAARSPTVNAPTTTPFGGPAGIPHANAAMLASDNSGAATHTSNVGFTAPVDVPSRRFVPVRQDSVLTRASDNPDVAAAKVEGEKTVPMASPSSIRNFVHRAIHEPDPARPYRINAPPDGGKNPARPVRIYADGVYDLFHYAHALQLRQAKLSFPSVHLVVGIVSSELCAAHKNLPVMTSQERYAAVRNCKWVDEVVEDAPWVITQELLDKLAIDYVAHDELPYAGAGSSAGAVDIYQFVKDQGRFLPTQRTEGVSTSELLARIVEQYRNHNYDKKLAKIGHEELAFE